KSVRVSSASNHNGDRRSLGAYRRPCGRRAPDEVETEPRDRSQENSAMIVSLPQRMRFAGRNNAVGPGTQTEPWTDARRRFPAGSRNLRCAGSVLVTVKSIAVSYRECSSTSLGMPGRERGRAAGTWPWASLPHPVRHDRSLVASRRDSEAGCAPSASPKQRPSVALALSEKAGRLRVAGTSAPSLEHAEFKLQAKSPIFRNHRNPSCASP